MIVALEGAKLPGGVIKNTQLRGVDSNGMICALCEIGLEEIANEYASNLSGGEIRRVSIIRAMINNPKVILADEPTSNLDPENSHKIMKMLQDISKSGTTVLLSTHELEYLSYVDTVFKMVKGNIMND